VNLFPAAAISAGAQWQVNGAYYNSGDVAQSLAPGQYAVFFKPISGYTGPASLAVNIVGNQQTTTNAIYSAVSVPTYMLTLSATGEQGSITAAPLGMAVGNTFTYTADSVVQLTANPELGYHFTNWSGDASGTVNPTTITINANKAVNANFAVGDFNFGTIRVIIQPSPAITAGAEWKFNSSGWTNSGAAFSTSLFGANQNYLQFSDVAGWVTPSPFFVSVGAGQTTNVTVTYQQDSTPGLLTVTLSPPDAVTAGAHWHVNGGTYGNGATASLTPGNYTVTFDAVSGWTQPASQAVTLQPAQTIVISGDYTPPAGQPMIGSLSPPLGPMTGKTLLTINGVNFTAPATVLIGGQPATSVTVSSPTQIKCLTPASTNYGSAGVVVQTPGGSTTSVNGFAYGYANGNKIALARSFGGSCFGVKVQGNYAYVGEGRNLLVLNVSNPSNPSKVGQVALPGPVMDLALLGNYAYVADLEGGLQVVDISNPAIPAIRGFYAPTNSTFTSGITIYGGRAYITDANADVGLEILDLLNPTMPALLSSTPIAGGAEDVAVKASVNGVFAYVTTGSSLQVIDVSQPSTPVLRGQTAIGSATYTITLSGNYVSGVDLGALSIIHMIDISNPDAPIDLKPSAGGYSEGSFSAVGVANNYLYAESYLNTIGLVVFNISGTNLVKVAQYANANADENYYVKMTISGGYAYVASGQPGLQIFDVSNPYSPSFLALFSDSSLYGAYWSVAATGNALCASDDRTFKVFDMSQPGLPLVANLSGTGVGDTLVAQNALAYLKASDGIRIYSVATPASPQLKATVANSVVCPRDMQAIGNMLYVAGNKVLRESWGLVLATW
jgi:hypothetical protein